MPTKLQKRASEILASNKSITPSNALIMAGYSKNNVDKNVRTIWGSDGMLNLKAVYQYELIKKGITPKKLAQVLQKGLKDQDKKVVLAYSIEAKKDLEIANDTPDTAIQINLGEDISKLAD